MLNYSLVDFYMNMIPDNITVHTFNTIPKEVKLAK